MGHDSGVEYTTYMVTAIATVVYIAASCIITISE